MKMVKNCLFEERYQDEPYEPEIEIKSINTWRMEGVLADSLIEKVKSNPRDFLAGDSAHAFPPSGGFGMNTGIGDAFNLAHKLS
jgi:2-polyprenyl-6-methoxyphenol hydroxylase-like FAD-dependent oxidoreductase